MLKTITWLLREGTLDVGEQNSSAITLDKVLIQSSLLFAITLSICCRIFGEVLLCMTHMLCMNIQ